MDNNQKSIEELIKSICEHPLLDNDPQDWKNLLKISNSTQTKGKECISQLIKFITDTKFMTEHQIILDIVDYLVDKSQLYFQSLVQGKQFLTCLLNLLKNSKGTKDLQIKILELIKKWGVMFESKKDIMPNYYETYKVLKEKGCEFPNNEKFVNNYKQYIGDEDTNVSTSKKNSIVSSGNLIKSEEKDIIQQHKEAKEKNNYGDINLNLNPNNYPKQLRLFVTELPNLLEYVLLDNELIDNFINDRKSNPNKKVDISIIDLTQTIQDLAVNIRKMLEKRITHERLTAICLGLLDDLDLLSERYNDLLNNQPVRVWKTAFKGEYAIYDLNNPNNIYKNEEDKKEGSSVSEESEGESEEDDNDE